MDFKILYLMTVLNILMLLVNIWLRNDSQKILEEIKERTDCRGLRPRNDREEGGFDENS